jgi:hypothetical protein
VSDKLDTILRNWVQGFLQMGDILREEGPGFVRGLQTRDRGTVKEAGPV